MLALLLATPNTNSEFYPSTLSPRLGVERLMLALLLATPNTNSEFYPSTLSPRFGVERLMLALLMSAPKRLKTSDISSNFS